MIFHRDFGWDKRQIDNTDIAYLFDVLIVGEKVKAAGAEIQETSIEDMF